MRTGYPRICNARFYMDPVENGVGTVPIVFAEHA
jgi:hypothetical protein